MSSLIAIVTWTKSSYLGVMVLIQMEEDAEAAEANGQESIITPTARCYVLCQTAWARGPSARKAEGALEVLQMMEDQYANGNPEARPTVHAFSMVLNACAFADMILDQDGRTAKASQEVQRNAFRIAVQVTNRLRDNPHPNVGPSSMTYGTFIKCCGRLRLPEDAARTSAVEGFRRCAEDGLVSDFVLTQIRHALTPDVFKRALEECGFVGRPVGHRIRISDLPREWMRNVNSNANFPRSRR